MFPVKTYCKECGHLDCECICVECTVCKKFFPEYLLYIREECLVCEKCMSKYERV